MILFIVWRFFLIFSWLSLNKVRLSLTTCFSCSWPYDILLMFDSIVSRYASSNVPKRKENV
jgi:hypothetical protein